MGLTRSENQDAFGCFPAQPTDQDAERLFVVADGMGGHTGGRQASQIAIETVPDIYFQHRHHPVPARLQAAFEAANQRIYTQTLGAVATGKMGTTCTALALSEGRLYLAHVGDSRAYRIRTDGLMLLTHDHTLVEQLRREGILTADEARRHPRRNVLTRAMGVAETLEVDAHELGKPASRDHFLLCSDGLARVTEEELLATVLQRPPQAACQRLIDLANERGGHDNATALVVRFN